MPKIPFKTFIARLQSRKASLRGNPIQPSLFPEKEKPLVLQAKKGAVNPSEKDYWKAQEKRIKVTTEEGHNIGYLDFYEYKYISPDEAQNKIAQWADSAPDGVFGKMVKEMRALSSKRLNVYYLGYFHVEEAARKGNISHATMERALRSIRMAKPAFVFFRIMHLPEEHINFRNNVLKRLYRSMGFEVQDEWGWKAFNK